MMPRLSRQERDDLVKLCRRYRAREIALPLESYSLAGGQWVVRVEIDGIRWVLHRWLYEQVFETELGSDQLKRKPGVSSTNVNPHLFIRIPRTAPTMRERCPNGHLYAEVGIVSDVKGTRCRRCYEDRLARRRVGGISKAEVNRRKTHCDHGHEFTPENTLRRPSDHGARRCATCERDRAAARKPPTEGKLR